MTEEEKRYQRQVLAYDKASDYDKGIMDCASWLLTEADMETSIAKRLAQQMRNKLFRGT